MAESVVEHAASSKTPCPDQWQPPAYLVRNRLRIQPDENAGAIRQGIGELVELDRSRGESLGVPS